MTKRSLAKYDTLIVGDVHGEWGRLNTLLDKKRPRVVLQVGDFGYWPRFHNNKVANRTRYDDFSGHHKTVGKPWNLYGIKNPQTTIHWVDGNHEDHDSLQKLESNETMPGIHYQPRGSTLTLPDGRVVLFIGGARSTDICHREPGVDWFEQEEITEADVNNLPKTNIDIVISHTCPAILVPEMLEATGNKTKATDPSCLLLNVVYDTYRPKYWYFGHWHRHISGRVDNTQWFCLDYIGGCGRSWLNQ